MKITQTIPSPLGDKITVTFSRTPNGALQEDIVMEVPEIPLSIVSPQRDHQKIWPERTGR